MKNSTKTFLSFLLVFFAISTSLVAQKTVTVGPTGDYLTIRDALDTAGIDMNIGEILYVNIPAGTIIQPMGNLFANWGKALNVIVSGAGADKTIITRTDDSGNPVTGPPEGLGGRLFQIGNTAMDSSTLIFKDMTFKYLGGNVGNKTTVGAVMNFVSEFRLSVTFENIVFDQCAGQSLISHNKDKIDFIFDNCLFTGCVSLPQEGTAKNHNGLIGRNFGGNVTVKNTTFISNIVKTPSDYTGDVGGLIQTVTSGNFGWKTTVVLDNVVAVNNRYSSESNAAVKQPMFSFVPEAENDSTTSLFVAMNNVISIDNSREEVANDVDLLYKHSALAEINDQSADNFFNKAIVVDNELYSDATLPGSNISENNTYSSLEIILDGEVPLLTPDEHGIGKISFVDHTGVAQTLVDNFPLKIYSEYSNIHISGLALGEKLEIFTITGSLYSSNHATNSEISMAIDKGIYIVRYMNKAQKIVVY